MIRGIRQRRTRAARARGPQNTAQHGRSLRHETGAGNLFLGDPGSSSGGGGRGGGNLVFCHDLNPRTIRLFFTIYFPFRTLLCYNNLTRKAKAGLFIKCSAGYPARVFCCCSLAPQMGQGLRLHASAANHGRKTDPLSPPKHPFVANTNS